MNTSFMDSMAISPFPLSLALPGSRVQCKSGHLMQKVKLSGMRGWVNVRVCERCMSVIGRSKERYHCKECDTNLCSNCITRTHIPERQASRDRSSVSPVPRLKLPIDQPLTRSATPPRGRSSAPIAEQHQREIDEVLDFRVQHEASPVSATMRSALRQRHDEIRDMKHDRSVSPAARSPRAATNLLPASALKPFLDLHSCREYTASTRARTPPPPHEMLMMLATQDEDLTPRGASSFAVQWQDGSSSPHFGYAAPLEVDSPRFFSSPRTPAELCNELYETSRLQVASPGTPRRGVLAHNIILTKTSSRCLVGGVQLSFVHSVEWIFYSEANDELYSMCVAIRPDGQGSRPRIAAPEQLRATWCPQGTACAEHGGRLCSFRSRCGCPFTPPLQQQPTLQHWAPMAPQSQWLPSHCNGQQIPQQVYAFPNSQAVSAFPVHTQRPGYSITAAIHTSQQQQHYCSSPRKQVCSSPVCLLPQRAVMAVF